jgi:hypothetical protein
MTLFVAMTAFLELLVMVGAYQSSRKRTVASLIFAAVDRPVPARLLVR